jgi:hypothetical protein
MNTGNSMMLHQLLKLFHTGDGEIRTLENVTDEWQ